MSSYYIAIMNGTNTVTKAAAIPVSQGEPGDVIVKAFILAPGSTGLGIGQDVSSVFTGPLMAATPDGGGTLENVEGPQQPWLIQQTNGIDFTSALIFFFISRG